MNDTRFIIGECLGLLERAPFTGNALDLVEPAMPVTELEQVRQSLLEKHKLLVDGIPIPESKDCELQLGFPQGSSAVLVTGVLWHHLKRSKAPLFPYAAFDSMQELVLSKAPYEIEDENHPIMEEDYIDAVMDTIELRELENLLLTFPLEVRECVRLVIGFLVSIAQQFESVNPVEIADLCAPILCRPARTAYMSIRHRRGVPYVRLGVLALMEKFQELLPAFQSQEVSSPTKAPPPIITGFSSKLSNCGESHSESFKSTSSSGKTSKRTSFSSHDSASSSPFSSSALSVMIPEPGHCCKETNDDDESWSLEKTPKGAARALSLETSGLEEPPMALDKNTSSTISRLVHASVSRACSGDLQWMDFARSACKDKPEGVNAQGQETEPTDDAVAVGSPNQKDEQEQVSRKLPVIIHSASDSSLLHSRQPAGSAPTPEKSHGVNQRLDKALKKHALHPDSRQEVQELEKDEEDRKDQNKGSRPAAAAKGQVGEQNDHISLAQQEQEKVDDHDDKKETKQGSLPDDEEMGPLVEERKSCNIKEDLLEDLETKKKELKLKLKQFDEVFERTHGRRPDRADKEPIRGLYEEYNNMKRQIASVRDMLDAERPVDTHQQRFGGGKTTDRQIALVKTLIAEKRALQIKLRDFEQHFESTHGRKIKYSVDIKGRESDYKRYKELKHVLSGAGYSSVANSPHAVSHVVTPSKKSLDTARKSAIPKSLF